MLVSDSPAVQLEESEIEKKVLDKATLIRSMNTYLSLQTSNLSSSLITLLTEFSSTTLLHCQDETTNKIHDDVRTRLNLLSSQLSLEVSAASTQIQDCKDLLINVCKLVLIQFFTLQENLSSV
eukprot:TRINITY_DN381_c0_g1_i2.p1 TRINITY_DN381_c0_g1~~TRINITY_DN381_c0_g1_i2.p1  ORF type:complete len:123 (-),score=36.07 TRINITY_DN381_c0_g1_i2:203-571(-)